MSSEHTDRECDPPLRFAARYPRDPSLDAALDAFRAGNYGKVRELTAALERGSAAGEVKEAARDLRSRTEADPLSKAILVATALLLFTLSAYWIAKAGGPEHDDAKPSAPPIERVKP